MKSKSNQDTQEIQSHLQAHLAAIVQSSDDAIISKTNEGTIIYWNKGAERLFGYLSEDVLGKSINILAPHQTDEHKEILNKYKNGIKLIHYETKRIKKDGSLIDVALTISPIHNKKHEIVGFSTIARDITAKTQYALYARSLIEASLDPLVTISADGKITDVNEALIKVTGVTREELIGTEFSSYFTEPEKAGQGYKQVFEKGFVADYPLTIKNINGTLTDVLYNASVYKDGEGKVLGVFAAARDITLQKQLAKREIEEREKELQRIEELERFRKLTIGRELKMIELKKEIEELKKQIEGIKK